MSETPRNPKEERVEHIQQLQAYYQTINHKVGQLQKRLDARDIKALGITQLLGRILEHHYPQSSRAVSFEALIGSTLRTGKDYVFEPEAYSLKEMLDQLLAGSFKTPEDVLSYFFGKLQIPRDEWLSDILSREDYNISGFGFSEKDG